MRGKTTDYAPEVELEEAPMTDEGTQDARACHIFRKPDIV